MAVKQKGATAEGEKRNFLPSTDFLFVNEAEIKGLSGKERGEHELLEKGCENVVVHRGAKGSSWINKDFERNCPAFDVKPITPTGVGDVFNAGFIYAFLEGREAEECLKFANACAAAHISKKRLKNGICLANHKIPLIFTRE